MLCLFVKTADSSSPAVPTVSSTSDLAASGPVAPATSSSRGKLEQILGVQSDPEFDLQVLQDRIMQNSCRWILNHDKFRAWRDEVRVGGELLWLTGLPGVGKSVLSSFIIQTLQGSPTDVICCYYFFNSRDQTKRSIKHMLTSIAFQIALQSAIFCERLIELHDASNFSANQLQAINVWESVFRRLLLCDWVGKPIFWVVDGLDEADHPELLTRMLSKLETDHRLRILIVSRPIKETGALQSFRLSAVGCEITLDDTSDDIRSYAYEEMSSILEDDALRDGVCGKILDKAQGSFLWVTLAIEQLRDHWHTPAAISQALEDLPEGMEEFYGKMMDIIAAQPKIPRTQASRILTWAICSFYPLQLRELEQALAHEFGQFTNIGGTIKQTCANFIVIRQSQMALIHDTARSFLIDRDGGRPLSVDRAMGELYVAQTCLGFLTKHLRNWRQTAASSVSVKEPPFLSYAITFWAYHVSRVPSNSDLTVLIQTFLSQFALNWIHAVALLGDLRILTRTAEHLVLFLEREGDEPSSRPKHTPSASAASEEVLQWATDLRRIVGRFGSRLVANPETIYTQTVPFCPTGSMIRRHFSNVARLSVGGISEEPEWDHRVAQITSVDDEEFTRVFAAGPYFVLVTESGILIVHDVESCQEARRIQNGETITALTCSTVSTSVAVAGTETIRVWDLATGEQLQCFQADARENRRVLALSFDDRDGSLLIGYDDPSVRCIDLRTSAERWNRTFNVPSIPIIPRWNANLDLMSIIPTRRLVILGYFKRPVYEWGLDSPEKEPRLCGFSPEFPGVQLHPFSPDWHVPRIIWRPGLLSAVFYEGGRVQQFPFNHEDDMQSFDRADQATEFRFLWDGTLVSVQECLTHIDESRTVPAQDIDMGDSYPCCLSLSLGSRRLYSVGQWLCNVWELHSLMRQTPPSRRVTSAVEISGASAREKQEKPPTQIYEVAPDPQGRVYCLGDSLGRCRYMRQRTARRSSPQPAIAHRPSRP